MGGFWRPSPLVLLRPLIEYETRIVLDGNKETFHLPCAAKKASVEERKALIDKVDCFIFDCDGERCSAGSSRALVWKQEGAGSPCPCRPCPRRLEPHSITLARLAALQALS